MRTIEVHVRTDKIQSEVTREIHVEDDCTQQEIEEAAREVMFDMIEWGWEEKYPS